MKLRMKIYNKLVNRIPAIQKRYHGLRQQYRGIKGRVYAWLALLGMNIAWMFGMRRFGSDYLNPDEKKRIPLEESESSMTKREAPRELAKRLLQYDVISFDIFDTLIYRPMSAPTDLFFWVGEKLCYMDFEHLRREMEWTARREKYAREKTYEVTLEDIYDVIEEHVGIPKELGMQAEISTELEMCFGNPYMLEVFQYLQGQGKTLVCTSDMYLPEDVIRQIVEKNGFQGIDRYFISCEEKASKGDGSLFAKVLETYGPDRRYVHVGDHPVSDVEQAEKAGLAIEYYQNANIAGRPYRAEDMSIMTGTLYRGIVNAHIHNGLHEYTQEYELGYIYGGLFVLGYCQWIHEYVCSHEIDKILFLARDGDIINKVYNRLYPEEARITEYVYWSRLAATKMGARYFKYDYFRRFVFHKVRHEYTLEQVFRSMEITDMLQQMCQELPECSPDSKLTDQNAGPIVEYLKTNWEQVLSHYEGQLQGGEIYFQRILGDSRKAVAVDIGWAGSGAVVLNHLVQKHWNINCEVIGLIAGTNTLYNAEPNMSEPMLYGGQLVSYLYSQENNRELWKKHDAAQGHNLFWEMLLESENKGFRGFSYANGREGYIWGEQDDNQQGIRELQQGILDYVSDYIQLAHADKKVISGSDVYYAMVALQNVNRKYAERLIKSFNQKIGVE
ncbi:MAG: HAD-IA family hydrolase [Acetatifactor sp.]|nr:HAD-IA family hydrolase [Acetatifactor sp.]